MIPVKVRLKVKEVWPSQENQFEIAFSIEIYIVLLFTLSVAACQCLQTFSSNSIWGCFTDASEPVSWRLSWEALKLMIQSNVCSLKVYSSGEAFTFKGIRHSVRMSWGIHPGKLKIFSHPKPPKKGTGRSEYWTLVIFKLFRCKILVGWLVGRLVCWLVGTQKTIET